MKQRIGEPRLDGLGTPGLACMDVRARGGKQELAAVHSAISNLRKNASAFLIFGLVFGFSTN
jgi:hypothetical protein